MHMIQTDPIPGRHTCTNIHTCTQSHTYSSPSIHATFRKVGFFAIDSDLSFSRRKGPNEDNFVFRSAALGPCASISECVRIGETKLPCYLLLRNSQCLASATDFVVDLIWNVRHVQCSSSCRCCVSCVSLVALSLCRSVSLVRLKWQVFQQHTISMKGRSTDGSNGQMENVWMYCVSCVFVCRIHSLRFVEKQITWYDQTTRFGSSNIFGIVPPIP